MRTIRGTGAEGITTVIAETGSTLEAYELLTVAEHWETEGNGHRGQTSVVATRREQVWEGADMKVAWEQYYESQGYSPYARCAKQECHAETPCVITKKF